MISRKKILSTFCDTIVEDCKSYGSQEVWHNKDKLFKDHIREILEKWDQMDDDIWAKVIFMEKNRRVAKAYVRAQVITFNGSDRGFDGHLVGLRGFANPARDEKTLKVLENFGEGLKMKIDESGDILIKRLTRSNIRVQGCSEDYACLGQELIESKGRLEMEKAMTLFQMKKLVASISNELQSNYPDEKRLERQCITCVSVDIESENLLETPCWMMIINIVAMEVIKYKLPCMMMMKQEKIPDFVAIFDNAPPAKKKMEPSSRKDQNHMSKLSDRYTRDEKENRVSSNNENNRNTSHGVQSGSAKTESRIPIEHGSKLVKSNGPKECSKTNEMIVEIPKPDYDKIETNGKMMENLKRRDAVFERNTIDKVSQELLLTNLPKIDESCLYQINACINGHSKTTGYLNSAMRKLPLNSRLSSCSSSSDSSQSGSEPSYYHIYSSIGDGIRITNCLQTNHLYPCNKIIKYYVGDWE